MMIIAPEANTAGQLEDYARLMFSKVKETNVPAWVIGAEEEVCIRGEFMGKAVALKIWPNKEPAKVILSTELNAIFDGLMVNHCSRS